MVRDRYCPSDRSGATVATGTLKAYGIVSGLNTENVIDRIILRSERRKRREELRKKEKYVFEFVEGIFYRLKKQRNTDYG